MPNVSCPWIFLSSYSNDIVRHYNACLLVTYCQKSRFVNLCPCQLVYISNEFIDNCVQMNEHPSASINDDYDSSNQQLQQSRIKRARWVSVTQTVWINASSFIPDMLSCGLLTGSWWVVMVPVGTKRVDLADYSLCQWFRWSVVIVTIRPSGEQIAPCPTESKQRCVIQVYIYLHVCTTRNSSRISASTSRHPNISSNCADSEWTKNYLKIVNKETWTKCWKCDCEAVNKSLLLKIFQVFSDDLIKGIS